MGWFTDDGRGVARGASCCGVEMVVWTWMDAVGC